MIEPIELDNATATRLGPRTEITKAAQAVIDEFVVSKAKACRVMWEDITDDFDTAKRQLSSRICWTRHYTDIKDIGIRSNRAKAEIYLIRKDAYAPLSMPTR